MEIVKNTEKNGEYDYYELHYLDSNDNEVESKEDASSLIVRYIKDGKFVSESFGTVYHEPEEFEDIFDSKKL